jgi:iron complex transport system permease protein
MSSRFSREALITSSLLIALLASVAVAVSQGALDLDLTAVFLGEARGIDTKVLSNIRAPRVVLAAAAGAGLAASGAVLQGLFRNPLADPGLIGVSGGAAVGAVAMIVLGAALNLSPIILAYSIPTAAILASLVVTSTLFLFASRHGSFNVATVLLAGIAINAIASVFIGIFQYASDDGQLRTLTFWMMGSFGRASWATVVPATLAITGALLLLLSQTRDLDRLQLGDAEAFYLGVNVQRVKVVIVFAAALSVGVAVSLSGIIGFVGLVVPHIVRFTVGVTHTSLVICSALLGASLLVMADLGARLIMMPAEVPVGLVTSAIGGPFFLWLIIRKVPNAF